MTSFYVLMLAWWHWYIQRILYLVPGLKPHSEWGTAPQWFARYYPAWHWTYLLDHEHRPGEDWLREYHHAVWYNVQDWIDVTANDARDTAVAWVRDFTGWVQHNYPTFSAWLEAIRRRVGTWLPDWADDLVDGLYKLYLAFPQTIRYAWGTWDDLWYEIKQAVKDWAMARYDDMRTWAGDAWNWVTGIGEAIRTWYDIVRDWVLGFVRDPYGTIVSLLGDTWSRIVTFARSALGYYFNLWGSYAQIMAAFWADPLNWLYDRAENLLIGKWG